MTKPIPFKLPYLLKKSKYTYELKEVLGSGAFSYVYLASRIKTLELFAIKVIPKNILKSSGDITRLQREIDSLAFLNSENILHLEDFFSDKDYFFLVTEYCSGGTMFDLVFRRHINSEKTVTFYFHQIVQAVDYLHNNGVAHRDLKLKNILLSGQLIKLADLGLCGFIDDKLMDTFCGSPSYLAPECLQKIPYDGKLADIWSLGVILYEMVVGRHPWNYVNMSIMIQQIQNAEYTIPNKVSELCVDLISKILQVKPANRLSIQDILQHKWLTINESHQYRPSSILSVKEVIDQRNSYSIEDQTKLYGMKTLVGNEILLSANQIVSPFKKSCPFSKNNFCS